MPPTTPNLGLPYPAPPALLSHTLGQVSDYYESILVQAWNILDAQTYGGEGGGMAIGEAVTGGDPTKLLFVDADDNLGQSTALTFDDATDTLTLDGPLVLPQLTPGSVLFVGEENAVDEAPTAIRYNKDGALLIIEADPGGDFGSLSLAYEAHWQTRGPSVTWGTFNEGRLPILLFFAAYGTAASPQNVPRGAFLFERAYNSYNGVGWDDSNALYKELIGLSPLATSDETYGRPGFVLHRFCTQDGSSKDVYRVEPTDVTDTLATPNASSCFTIAGQTEIQSGGLLASNYLKRDAAAGSEQVANGNFTGNADNWTLGTGFTYNSNAVNKDGDGTAALEQDVSAVDGEIYLLTYTISNYTVGSVTPQVGNANGTARSANGTYSDSIHSIGTGNLQFVPTNTARFTIDTVSVKKVGYHQQPAIANPTDSSENLTATIDILTLLRKFALIAT